MTPPEGKLEVVRKLLAKAERAGTPAEADAFNTKAAELMARHGIDSAMLAAAGRRRDEIGQRRTAMSDPYSMEESQLASWTGSALGCRAIRHGGMRRGQVEAVTLFGFRSDLERAELMFTSLLLQATRAVVVQRPAFLG